MCDGIHQMGTEPYRVAWHIIGTVGVQVELFLRCVQVVLQDALLDVQRVSFLLQLLDSTAQDRFPSIFFDLFTHTLNAVSQLLKLLVRHTTLIVHGQLTHYNGNGLVIGRVMAC